MCLRRKLKACFLSFLRGKNNGSHSNFNKSKELWNNIPNSIINDIIKNTSFNNLKRFEKENGFKEAVNNKKFFRAGKIGDYKNHKNDGFKLIEKKFSEVMAKCNYL